MNTKIVIGVVAALVVALGGVMFLAPERTQDSTEVAPGEEVAIDSEERMKGTGVMANLFGKGDSLICNYSYTDETGMNNEGTMYYDAASERFHVRNEMTDATGEYKSGIINDGTTMYTWNESAEGVFALAMPVSETPEVEESDGTFEDADMFEGGNDENDRLEIEVDYDCVAWTVDESVFVPPSNVEFMNPQSMLEAALGGAAMPEFDPNQIPELQ